MGPIMGVIALTAIVWSVRRWRSKNQDVGRGRSCLGLIGAVLLGFLIAIPFQIGAQILFLSMGSGRTPVSNNRQFVSQTASAVIPASDLGVCAWLAKAQILMAERISGASQIADWLDKYRETGFESSVAIEDFVVIIKRYQPYQREFVDDWIELGSHVDGKGAWEKELSGNQLRIQALDEIIEGYESSDIDKFNHGLTILGESARLSNEASTAMLDIAKKCTISPAELSSIITVQSTVTPTPRPEPSPTPALEPVKPSFLVEDGTTWVYYEDQDSHFAAYYPENWEPKLIPPEPDNPARGVLFVAPLESSGAEGNSMISVISLPTLNLLGSISPDTQELKQLLQDVLENAELEIITPPTETKIHGYPAVRLVTQTSLSDKNYPIRGYTVATTIDQWVYIIQVTGLATYDDELQAMYTRFVENFSSKVP